MDNVEIKTIVVSRTFRDNFLLSFGLIGPLLFWIVNFLFGIATVDYDHISQSISDLQLAPNGWIQSANFVVYGLCTVIFATGLRKELVVGRAAAGLPLMLILNGVGLILSGFIARDPVHTYTRLLSLIALVISFYFYALRFKGDPRWKGWAIYAIINIAVVFIALVLFIHTKNSGGYPGIFERVVVFVRTAWAIIFTIRLLTFAGLEPLDKPGV